MRIVRLDIGGEVKEFPLGVSTLLYGSVASGKTTFSLTLAREFLKNSLPCIWICLDESPLSIREKMEYFKVDYRSFQDHNLLRFIDAYSEQVTGKGLNDPYVINCTSAVNLNELNRMLMRALSEVKGQGLVVFDSVSTLLLYNRPSTCEEFLKVHISRITSAGFTGTFILQRDLHDPQTEETLKMMCDSVLEFGFDKGVRKISVLKLPLGQTGEWIESSLFAWQQQPGVTVSRPAGPRKYMDAGGYLEDFKEGLVEGLKEGLSNIKMEPGKIDEKGLAKGLREGLSNIKFEGSGGRSVGGAAPPAGGAGGEGGPGGAGGGSMGPTVQHIDKQIIVADMNDLPDKLGEEIKDLLNEQLRLREVVHEKEEQSRESRKRLDLLLTKENQAKSEVREIEERKTSVRRAVAAKQSALADIEKDRGGEEERYRELVEDQDKIKERIDRILDRKKNLEDKIQSLVEGGGELYIDLTPYLKDVLAKREKQVAESKEKLESLDSRREAVATEINLLKDELKSMVEEGASKKEELEDVRDRKAKVEDELGFITQAREETESKLKEVLDKKKAMEKRLQELTEGEG